MCFCASEVSARGNAGVSAAMESGTKLLDDIACFSVICKQKRSNFVII